MLSVNSWLTWQIEILPFNLSTLSIKKNKLKLHSNSIQKGSIMVDKRIMCAYFS